MEKGAAKVDYAWWGESPRVGASQLGDAALSR